MKNLAIFAFIFLAIPLAAHAQRPPYQDAYTDAQAIAAASTMPVLLPVYDNAGSQKTPSHIATGRATLVAGASTVTLTGASAYTSTTTYFCQTNDQSATGLLSTISYTSGTAFTIRGNLTDVISWFCLGW